MTQDKSNHQKPVWYWIMLGTMFAGFIVAALS